MRINRMPILLAILAILVCSFVPQAHAETTIAVVNFQKLLRETKAAEGIQKQIQERREAFLEKLSKEEQALTQTRQALLKEKADLSPEDFTKRQKDFEESYGKTQKMAQEEKRSLDQASLKAMAELEKNIFQQVQQVADEKNYTLVLRQQLVVIGEKSIDITDEVMKRLNKTVSEIKLEK